MCIPFNLCGLRGILDLKKKKKKKKKTIIGAQDTCVYVTGVIWGVFRYVWDILRE